MATEKTELEDQVLTVVAEYSEKGIRLLDIRPLINTGREKNVSWRGLSRAAKRLYDEGRIGKKGNLYYPKSRKGKMEGW